VQCYLDDYVGQSVYYFGDLDPKLSWILQTVLRPGDQFIDVGANIGLLTFLGSQLVGETGRVLAIDPQPKVVVCLENALERNQTSNVVFEKCGVGEQSGELTLHVPSGNLGSASFTALPGEKTETFRVPVRTLKEILKQHQFESCRLVKLDVEDWEAEVVGGAEEVWRKTPPPAIIFEFREATNISDSEVGQRLARLGYRFYRIPRNLFRPQLVLSDSGFSHTVTHDVFAVHESFSCQELGFSANQVIE
jgi:FkbM family methyltransferase